MRGRSLAEVPLCATKGRRISRIGVTVRGVCVARNKRFLPHRINDFLVWRSILKSLVHGNLAERVLPSLSKTSQRDAFVDNLSIT